MRPCPLCRPDNSSVLIILQLHGGNDGSNMLIPVQQYDTYYSRRANIAIPAANSVRKMIPLDGTLPSANQVGLHPDMIAAKRMYDQGKVNFIQAVCVGCATNNLNIHCKVVAS